MMSRLKALLLGFISTLIAIITLVTVAGANTTFSQANFVVKFNSLVGKNDNTYSYTEHDLLPMIKTISTKFSNIFSHVHSTYPREPSSNYIPTATAKFNVNSPKKLQVYVISALKQQHLQFDGTTQSPFQLAIKLARQANYIYPQTVEYLILNEKLTPANLQLAKRILRDELFRYKLGQIALLSSCLDPFKFENETVPLLPKLDMIIFSRHLYQHEYSAGANKSSQNIIGEFEKCKEIIKELNVSTDVAFATEWGEESPSGWRHLQNHLDYWIIMNDYAKKKNTKIFMEEAFDIPSHNTSKLGWWRLFPKSYRSNNNYVFEEKETGLKSKQTNFTLVKNVSKNEREWRKEDEVDINSPSHPSTFLGLPLWGLILFSVSLVLICLSSPLYVLYWYKRRRRQLGPKSEEYEQLLLESNNYYEVPTDKFTLKEGEPLGSGEFGQVCVGTVTKDSERIKVAIKMPKHQTCSITQKGLISEIRTLATIGKHSNVVELIGACTKDVQKNKIYVFLEFCEFGTLEGYLRKRKLEVQASDIYENAAKAEFIELETELKEKMARWANEIAIGMEYIASKNVVHMDLATRNVLLTTNQVAKISDFGLSRRLYNYQCYTKSNQEPLPWRWMSPESLQQLEFTEKSDVWSYGVTLWEIYSLGDIPYGGMSWDVNFANSIVRGLRLGPPQFNCDGVFGNIIKACWALSPERRPTFSELVGMLRD